MRLGLNSAVGFSGGAMLQAKPVSPPRRKTVAVYGGNSVEEGSPLYRLCYRLGEILAKAGFGVLTGGGEGAMRAVTEGAKKRGGYTIGMAMPFIGETPCDSDETHFFDTFSARIDEGYEARSAMTIAVPGGIGTLQEVTKKATELYLNKTIYPSQKQILLVEHQGYWKRFIDYLQKGPVAQGLMNPKVLDLFKIVRLSEVVPALKQNVPWTKGMPHMQKPDLYQAKQVA